MPRSAPRALTTQGYRCPVSQQQRLPLPLVRLAINPTLGGLSSFVSGICHTTGPQDPTTSLAVVMACPFLLLVRVVFEDIALLTFLPSWWILDCFQYEQSCCEHSRTIFGRPSAGICLEWKSSVAGTQVIAFTAPATRFSTSSLRLNTHRREAKSRTFSTSWSSLGVYLVILVGGWWHHWGLLIRIG